MRCFIYLRNVDRKVQTYCGRCRPQYAYPLHYLFRFGINVQVNAIERFVGSTINLNLINTRKTGRPNLGHFDLKIAVVRSKNFVWR